MDTTRCSYTAPNTGKQPGCGTSAPHSITAIPALNTIIVHDAGRGKTPECPGAKFKRGDVVRVRNTKAVAHFPREAVVAVAVPAGFPADYALADLLNEPRPLMIRKPRRVTQYVLVNEGDLKPYLARERDLLPTGKPAVEIGSFAREPVPQPGCVELGERPNTDESTTKASVTSPAAGEGEQG